VIAVSVLVAALSGAFAESSSWGEQSPPVVNASSPDSAIAEHDAMVAYVQAHPDLYSGVEQDPASPLGLVVTVPVSGSATAARTTLKSVAASARTRLSSTAKSDQPVSADPTVQFQTGSNTLAQITAAQDAVTAASDAGKSWTTNLVQWGPTNDGRLLIATLTAPTTQEQGALTNRLGVTIELVPGNQSTTTGRQNDTSPFYGGGRIVSTLNEACTAGFAVYKGSTPYILTAGHCGLGTWHTPANVTLGTVAQRSYSNKKIDAEIISVKGSVGWVLTGGPTGSTTHKISGTYAIAGGESSICLSGSYSGEVCANQVPETNQCVKFTNTGVTTCNLSKVANPSNIVISQGGDSGGPVYRQYGGKYYAAGTIIGAPNGSGPVAWVLPISYSTSAFGISVAVP